MTIYVAAHGTSQEGAPPTFVPPGVTLTVYVDFDWSLPADVAMGLLAVETFAGRSAARATYRGGDPIENLRLRSLESDFFAALLSAAADGVTLLPVGSGRFPRSPVPLCDGNCAGPDHECTGLLARLRPDDGAVGLVCCRQLVDAEGEPVTVPVRADRRPAGVTDDALTAAQAEQERELVDFAVRDPDAFLRLFDTFAENSRHHLRLKYLPVARLVEQRTVRQLIAEQGRFAALAYLRSMRPPVRKYIVGKAEDELSDVGEILSAAHDEVRDFPNLTTAGKRAFWNGLAHSDKKFFAEAAGLKPELLDRTITPNPADTGWFTKASETERLNWWWALGPASRAEWRADRQVATWLATAHFVALSAWFTTAPADARADWAETLDGDDVAELAALNPTEHAWVLAFRQLTRLAEAGKWPAMTVRYGEGLDPDREIIDGLGRFRNPVDQWIDELVDPAKVSRTRTAWFLLEDRERAALSNADERISLWLRRFAGDGNRFASAVTVHNSEAVQNLVASPGKTVRLAQAVGDDRQFLVEQESADPSDPELAPFRDHCLHGLLRFDAGAGFVVTDFDDDLDATGLREVLTQLGYPQEVTFAPF